MDERSSMIQSEGDQSGKKEFSEIITIRSLELSTVDDLMVWVPDERVTKYFLLDTCTSKDQQAIDFTNNMVIPHPWLRVICINKAIGIISVTPNSGNDYKCRAALGYILAHSFWGKGIMTKAVEMVISTIFEEWPYLERLETVVDVDNKGSQRVLEKAGFQREGVLRKYKLSKGNPGDFVMFSFLSSDRS